MTCTQVSAQHQPQAADSGVLAEDASGNQLGIEVTLTEDHPGDIAAALGRSDQRSIEALKVHLQRVKEGKEPPLQISVVRSSTYGVSSHSCLGNFSILSIE